MTSKQQNHPLWRAPTRLRCLPPTTHSPARSASPSPAHSLSLNALTLLLITMDTRPSPTVVPSPALRARLPAFVRLPMLIILNIGLQTALWSTFVNYFGPELGAVSKRPDESDWIAPLLRLASKTAMVSIAWWLRYDCKTRPRACAVISMILTLYIQISILAHLQPWSTSHMPISSPPTIIFDL